MVKRSAFQSPRGVDHAPLKVRLRETDSHSMFRRRSEYLISLDVELDQQPVETLFRPHAIQHPRPVDAEELETLIVQVRRAGQEAVRATRQRWKSDGVDADGDWLRFEVRVRGDAARAEAAMTRWRELVESLERVRRVLAATVRGDGTTLAYMHPDYVRELDAALGRAAGTGRSSDSEPASLRAARSV